MKIYPKDTSHISRIEEIDFLRGIAIILMVVYHWFALLDIKTGTKYTSNIFLDFIGQVSRIIFILLVGISTELSKQKNDTNLFIEKQLEKVLHLIIYALSITIVTKFVYPKLFIRFGILHYMSITLLLLTFMSFLNNKIPFRIGIFMLFIYTIFMVNTPSNNFFLNILGFKLSYNTMDFFPIFRWFWLSTFGLLISKSLYKNNKRTYTKPIFNKEIYKNIIKLGKYSLEIYLIHFPIIYLIQDSIYG